MEEIRSIETPVWDLRVINLVGRELDKAFNSLTSAFNNASKEVTEENQAELNKKANHFYDLMEKRQIEYEECTIEDNAQAKEASDLLYVDIARYKEACKKQFMVTPVDDIDELVDATADEPAIEGRMSLLQEEGEEGEKQTKEGEEGVTPPPAEKTQPTSVLASLGRKMSSAMDAGKKAIGNVVNSPTAKHRQPPPPPPPSQPADPPEETSDPTGRPPLPRGFQNFENERQKEADATKRDKTPSVIASTAAATSHRKGPASTASSRKSSSRGSQKSKVASIMSDQIERDKRKKVEAEKTRVESNDAQTDAEIAKRLSEVEELKRQKKIDRQLHKKELENIEKHAEELQAIVTAAEEENQSIAASGNDLEDKTKENGAGLEMTIAGIALGGENPSVTVSNWIKGVNDATTSTAKKDKKPKKPSLPERAMLDPPKKAKKKLNVGIAEEEKKEVKPLIFPVRTMRDVKPKKSSKKEPVKNETEKRTAKKEEEEKKKVGGQRARASVNGANGGQTAAAAQTPAPRSPSSSSTRSNRSTTSSKAPSIASSDASSNVSSASKTMMNLMLKMQQQQLEATVRQNARAQLKELRPNKKFTGSTTKRMDFEKHMKQLDEILEIPGVTKKQILNEFQHWFEGPAFKLIEAETMKNAESAVDEAITKLTKKFGMRQESAMEMLDEVIQGKPIDAKDHNGLLDFYAKLVSIHSLACETGRGEEFENKLVVKTIMEKKLPHLKDKWAQKAVKYRKKHGSDMKFAEFLEYIDDEQLVSEMLSRYNSSSYQNKTSANAKVSATSANMATKKEGTTAPSKKTAPGQCLRCDAMHKLEECTVYREMSSADRRKFNKNQGLCFRCLEAGHLMKNCTSAIVCDKCDIPHHPLTHPDGGGGKRNTEEKAATPPKPEA